MAHQYHIGWAEVAEIVLEPREGGRWYGRGVHGGECDFGRVLVWGPLHRVMFIERLDGGQAVHDASGGGWSLLLEGYAKVATGGESR